MPIAASGGNRTPGGGTTECNEGLLPPPHLLPSKAHRDEKRCHGECPILCVGMSEKEPHAYEHQDRDREGRTAPRRRLAERARSASAARCRRRARRGRLGRAAAR